jgi:hypothetical protein
MTTAVMKALTSKCFAMASELYTVNPLAFRNLTRGDEGTTTARPRNEVSQHAQQHLSRMVYRRGARTLSESEQAAREEQELRAKAEGGKKYGCGEIVLVGKSLVVGQVVDLSSGVYGQSGKVVEVTPEGVSVQTFHHKYRFDYTPPEILHFSDKGQGLDDEGTFEEGPWIIVDICPHLPASDGHHCTRCWTVMIPWEAK